MGLKEHMPLLARHEGVWAGTYRIYDANGKLVDEHSSRVVCRFPAEGGYIQTNSYSWPDGRSVSHNIEADYRDGRIWWDGDIIRGWAGELPLDENGRSIVLYWQHVSDPELYVYEMVQISDDGKKRCRTWHWIRNGELEARTAIEEKLVTRDWQAEDDRLSKAA